MRMREYSTTITEHAQDRSGLRRPRGIGRFRIVGEHVTCELTSLRTANRERSARHVHRRGSNGRYERHDMRSLVGVVARVSGGDASSSGSRGPPRRTGRPASGTRVPRP
jgi:hypothetical protein